jgi:hypothetical protein
MRVARCVLLFFVVLSVCRQSTLTCASEDAGGQIRAVEPRRSLGRTLADVLLFAPKKLAKFFSCLFKLITTGRWGSAASKSASPAVTVNVVLLKTEDEVEVNEISVQVEEEEDSEENLDRQAASEEESEAVDEDSQEEDDVQNDE